MQKIFNTKHENIMPAIQKKSLEILKDNSSEQFKTVEKIIDDFSQEIKSNKKLRKRLGYSEKQAKSFNKNNLMKVPEKSVITRLAKAAVAPFVALGKGVMKLAFDNNFGKKHFTKTYNFVQKMKKQDKIVKDYKNVEGLFNSVEKWENQFRKRYGLEDIKKNEDFVMENDHLKRNLRCRSFEVIDPNKGSYSTKGLSVGNRVVSGVIGSLMYGVDAYNTTMRLSDDKQVSAKEGKVKFAQQLIRIGLASFFTATAFGVFKKQTNKSMSKALALSGGMVVASEVLGRKLVGKPILPTSKEKLEQINQDNEKNPNMIVKFGRILSGESKYDKKVKQTPKIELSQKFIDNRYKNRYNFGSESAGTINFGASAKMFKKNELLKMVELIDNVDEKLGEYFKKKITQSLIQNKKIDDKTAEKPFEKAIAGLNEIQIGTHSTKKERIKKVLLTPIKWVKNIFVKPYKWAKKVFSKNNTKKENPLADIKKKGLENEYNEALAKFKKSKVYKAKSNVKEDKKVEAFTKEFLFLNEKGFDQEIQGIQNSLEWLKKNVKNKDTKNQSIEEVVDNILKNKDKPEVQKHLKNINKKMNDMSINAYSRDYADYDSAKYSVANNYTARILSTLFLVFDTYNLTMLHSNNKAKATENSSQRATQEITRTVMSSYMIHATNTVFQKFHNASLVGALTLTAGSSTAVNALSRFAVGKPITPKDKKELVEQEEKNKRNPLLKVTAAMVGKSMKKMDYGEEKKPSKNVAFSQNFSTEKHKKELNKLQLKLNA